jgi:hypothetical protein
MEAYYLLCLAAYHKVCEEWKTFENGRKKNSTEGLYLFFV